MAYVKRERDREGCSARRNKARLDGEGLQFKVFIFAFFENFPTVKGVLFSKFATFKNDLVAHSFQTLLS